VDRTRDEAGPELFLDRLLEQADGEGEAEKVDTLLGG
jgi:hypothetical protein